jgi:Uma2 family endonuclease
LTQKVLKIIDMIGLAAETTVAFTPKASRTRRSLPKSRAEFLQWQPRDGYKYEWSKGRVLKFEKMITPEQAHIVDNLTEAFHKTTYHAAGGRLMPELMSQTVGEQVRVPDIAFVTLEQRRQMQSGQPVVPAFAIEIISKNDKAEDVEEKLEEYFKAGVKVVWRILPRTEKIYVFTSPYAIQVCRGEMLCSAAPALTNFELTANAIFKKI